MARQEFKVQANNFTGGLVTEASPLSFPENSCLDIENMDIGVDGSVSRRHALRPELELSDHIPSTILYNNYEAKSPVYVWRQAAGIPQNNLVCVQDGDIIRFYRETDSLDANILEATVDLEPHKTEVINPQPPVSMTNVRGVLVITARNINPVAVEYNDISPPSFTTTPINFTIRDLDGVEDGLRVDERPTDLTNEHLYNLINQGWDIEKINEFEDSEDVYPSNADIWAAAKDANNEFDPSELVKIDFGTSSAPRGRLTLNLFDTRFVEDVPIGTPLTITDIEHITSFPPNRTIEITTDEAHGLSFEDEVLISGVVATCGGQPVNINGVHTVSQVLGTFVFRISVPADEWCVSPTITNLGVVYTDFLSTEGQGYVTNARPTVVSTYAGRAFYAGVPFERLSNQIFFSQILTDTRKRLGRCLQEADPTSEIDPDIVATDGGVITINDLGDVLAMREQQQQLVVFTTNGVWEISGEGDSFFSALGYSVRKITSVPVTSGCAIVDVEGTLMFMGEDGIYMLQPNEVTGFLTAINITANRINNFYLNNVMPCGEYTCGVYDYKRRQVLWLYGIPPSKWPEILPGGESPNKGRLMTNALVFSLDTQSFTKYRFAFTYLDIATPDFTTPRIIGAVALRNISPNSPAIRFFVRYMGEDFLSYIGWLQLDKPKVEGFVDSTLIPDEGLEAPSFVITGHATLDDIGARKSARQLILHMLRTETGFKIATQEACSIELTFLSEEWGDELTWALTDADDEIVLSGGPYFDFGFSDVQNIENATDGPYTLTLTTEDGEFCDNNVQYTVRVNGVVEVFSSIIGCTNITIPNIGEFCTGQGSGGADPIHPSSAKVRIAWDFTNDEASNKWMPEFQGYRYRQLWMPEVPGGFFNTGYEVITTKTKLRGTGRAFSMQFRSELGHDMNILGWSITGSAEANE